MKLISNGYVMASVVCPEDATPQEEFAAEELSRYLEAMSLHGCSDVLVSRILVGGPERNSQVRQYISCEEFAALVPGPEGMLIRLLDADTLLIAGSEGDCCRGTIYGVYEFLERFCGCSLSPYSHPDVDAGELVLQRAELSLEEVSYLYPKASRPKRGACVQFGDAAGDATHDLNIPFLDFLAKNRYNLFSTWAGVYEQMKKQGLMPQLRRRGIQVEVGHHDSSDLFLPAEGNEYFPEKYYETHPEFFRLQEDGTRYHPNGPFGQMIFCYRNPELVEVFSNNMIAWLTDNPDVVSVSLLPHDGMEPQCCCPLCKPYGKTENYCSFIDAVARRVSAVHPHVQVGLLLYVDIWECPESVTLSPSVSVTEATWAAWGLRTAGKPDGTCLIHTPYEENLLSWKRTGAQLSYYDYYMGVYQERQRQVPMADELQAIWKRFLEKDIAGGTTQIECYHIWNYLVNFYCYGRTAYDVSLSLEDHLQRLCRIFGEGAMYIADVIRAEEACLDGQVAIRLCGLYLMSHIDKDFVYGCFEKALAAASQPRARNNIRLMRMAFRYTDLETQQQNAENMAYQKVRIYPNIDPELVYMTKFDSFWNNNPGYGITIPTTGEPNGTFVPDYWYLFE